MIDKVRGALARLDAENMLGTVPLKALPEAKIETLRDNGIAATLEGLNSVPGLSTLSGIATLGLAGFKLYQTAGAAIRGAILQGLVSPGAWNAETRGYAIQAAKLGALGTLAVFGGPIGNGINFLASVKDGIDVVNTAID
jgi:hypothetical protein